MSAPGWYPDPAGTPGTFRYWDGRTWAAETTTDPRRSAAPTPPTAPATTPHPTPTRRSRGPVIIAVAVLVLVLIAGVLAVRSVVGGGGPGTAEPAPTSSVSGWDDSSPTSSPTPSTPTPSEEQQPCPRAYAESVQHPSDGRIHGGGLSFRPPTGWETGNIQAITWASDTAGVYDRAEDYWIALFAVGALATSDGFREPQAAARLVMQCVATSDYYQHFTGSKDLSARAVTVDGRAGWAIRTEIRVDDDRVEADGDVVEVVVVQTGAADRLGMFLGSAPLGDATRIKQLDATVAGLAVDR